MSKRGQSDFPEPDDIANLLTEDGYAPQPQAFGTQIPSSPAEDGYGGSNPGDGERDGRRDGGRDDDPRGGAHTTEMRTCAATGCHYNTNGGCSLPAIEINEHGGCDDYEACAGDEG